MELDYEPTVADRSVAQRKLMVEANRRPPDVVDVSRAVTAGQGGVAVTAGRRAPQWPPTAVAAPGPRPGGEPTTHPTIHCCTSSRWHNRRSQPRHRRRSGRSHILCSPDQGVWGDPRRHIEARDAIADQQLRGVCSELEISGLACWI